MCDLLPAIRTGLLVLLIVSVIVIAILLVFAQAFILPTSTLHLTPSILGKTDASTPQKMPTPRIEGVSRVLVSTDRREYRQGDTVAIAVRNETDRSIWYSAGQRFWTLERLDPNNRWIEVNFSFPVSGPRSGTEMCSYIVHERPDPSELKAREVLHAVWPLAKICEWPLEPIGVPTAAPKPVPPGTYRVVFIYGLSSSYESLSAKKEYSDSIVIR